MNRTLSGSTTESRRVLVNALDSIRNNELDWNEIDESACQFAKHDEQKTSTP
jgi:hypothetical protein